MKKSLYSSLILFPIEEFSLIADKTPAWDSNEIMRINLSRPLTFYYSHCSSSKCKDGRIKL
ncbi:MAG: hypothetical protein ACK4NF_06060 [Planctomycetota bacterium]